MKTLLDIVSRQPDSAFLRLISALEDTQQTDAAEYLRNSAQTIIDGGSLEPTTLRQPTLTSGQLSIFNPITHSHGSARVF